MNTLRDITIFVIFISSIARKIEATSDCPMSWTNDTRKSRCIKVMNEINVSHAEAVNNCKSHGAELIRIEDEGDHLVVVDLLESKPNCNCSYYIQMHWADGSWKFDNGDDVPWVNWALGQPDDPFNADCVVIDSNTLTWHDAKCDKTGVRPKKYICALNAVQGQPTWTRYVKEGDNCIEKHTVSRRYNTDIFNEKWVISSCGLDCTQDADCAAMATSGNECIIYKFNSSNTVSECVGSTHELYRKT